MANEQYIWHTEQDSDVRSRHAIREGKTFSWENPPVGGHPGEDFGCRCWAENVAGVKIKEHLITPTKGEEDYIQNLINTRQIEDTSEAIDNELQKLHDQFEIEDKAKEELIAAKEEAHDEYVSDIMIVYDVTEKEAEIIATAVDDDEIDPQDSEAIKALLEETRNQKEPPGLPPETTSGGPLTQDELDKEKETSGGGLDENVSQDVEDFINDPNNNLNENSAPSEILLEMQGIGELATEEEFNSATQSFVDSSINPEEVIQDLIDNGIVVEDENGNLWITNNNSQEPVLLKLSEEITYNIKNMKKKKIILFPFPSPNSPISLNKHLTLKELENTDGVDIGWQEIFEFNESSVLDILIDNFHKLKDKLLPPIKLGHNEKQTIIQNSGYPSAGWISDLKRKEGTNKLLAYFSKVPPLVAKLIEKKKYLKLSAEIYHNFIDPNTSKQYGPTFRGVAIEGADIPEIKTLKDLNIVYYSDNLTYEILSKENIVKNPAIIKLKETIKILQTQSEIIKQKGDEDSLKLAEHLNEQIIALEVEIAKLEVELDGLKKSKLIESDQKMIPVIPPIVVNIPESLTNVPEAPNPAVFEGLRFNEKDSLQLSETVKTQETTILKLSESVKTLGTELKSASDHILESKKIEYKSRMSRVCTPAFIEESLKYINFSEEDDVLDLVNTIIKLHENKSLFLPKSLDLNEDIVNPTAIGKSSDVIYNKVLKLSETEKIPFQEAFTRLADLNQLT